ncbi:MAG: CbtA family protein [Nitrososphaera sp.]|jgi:predicted cobalt transporter CbtA
MKALTFIAITLFSGALAGVVLAIVNQGIVEPYIERAIAIENQRASAQGEMINPVEFQAYRVWQKGGSVAAGAVLGMSYGALFGLVFAYGRNSLPGSTNLKKALVLAAIMWFTLYVVVELKYPANPPAVGDPATIGLRQSLWVAMISISGLSALGLAVARRWMKGAARIAAPVTVYAAIVIAAFAALPANPDAVTAPMDLVTGFRIASGATMTMFWLVMGATLGMLWDRTKPHETAKVKAV